MNSLWLDEHYLRLVSSRLPKFKQCSAHTFNARCIICGDSDNSKTKARWYAFESKGTLLCKCHNCEYSAPFSAFLKRTDPELHKQYSLERFKHTAGVPEQANTSHDLAIKMKPPVFASSSQFKTIKKISQLRVDHPAKLYVERRLIPPDLHHKLYYAPNFKTWVNTIVPGKFDVATIDKDEPRLIIPLLDANKKLIGFQGRSFFAKSKLKYITIMLDSSKGNVFGMDTVNPEQDIYVVEGPIDSFFIPNAIATCGGDLLREIKLSGLPKDKIVVVYDNEPRSAHTCKKIETCVNEGYRVCIWPEIVIEKDINAMILANYSSDKIVDIITKNTYNGLIAKLVIQTKKRC